MLENKQYWAKSLSLDTQTVALRSWREREKEGGEEETEREAGAYLEGRSPSSVS